MTYQHITSRCFISIPFARLRQDLRFVLAQGIQPEIGLEGDSLYTCSTEGFREIAAALKGAGLRCTLHAPFFDLAPGALDEYILAATREKLRRAFALIEIFQPLSVVCHLGFEENKQGFQEDAWFARALATWQEMLGLAARHRVVLALENTYETEPGRHEKMLAALNSPFARFCLDVGHVMAFAKSTWQEWLPRLSPWLGQLHLHDNHGSRDEHLAPGRGNFDFPGLFAYLRAENLSPIVTLEPHSEEDLWESLAALDRMELFPKKQQ